MLDNPHRGKSLDIPQLADIPFPIASAAFSKTLLSLCPVAAATPLVKADGLAQAAGVSQVWVKDERTRLGLGSFKALGAAYAIAREVPDPLRERPATALKDRVFVTASAGNHGLSMAAGARVFGAHAVVYLADTVPEAFAERLRGYGAEVVRAGQIYEQSMQAAAEAAADKGWTLLSDSSWTGYTDMPGAVMEGYTVLADEVVTEIPEPPTHIMLQAGVGGLAAAMAAAFRAAWGDAPQIIVVEPHAAPALYQSILKGEPVVSEGPVSSMGRLDCKEPSYIAFKGLARDADVFALVQDADVDTALKLFAQHGLETSPSGGAGLAAVFVGGLSLPKDARVLAILSEGPI